MVAWMRVTPDDLPTYLNVKHLLALVGCSTHVKPAAAVSGGDAAQGVVDPNHGVSLKGRCNAVRKCWCELYPWQYCTGYLVDDTVVTVRSGV